MRSPSDGGRFWSARVYAAISLAALVMLLYSARTPNLALGSYTYSYSYPPFRHTPFPVSPLLDESALVWPAPAPAPAALSSTLATALARLLTTPIPSYEESARRQRGFCPRTHEQSNRDQINGEADWWEHVHLRLLDDKRRQVAQGLADRLGLHFDARNPAAGLEQGDGTRFSQQQWAELFGNGKQGIVMTGGNGDTARRVLTALRILRNRYGSKLAVEVFCYPDEADLGGLRDEIEALGEVVVREIWAEREQGVWKQFQLKGEALARASFTEVLYLDSDNIPTRDPAFLFDSPAYREFGLVLWPDFSKDSADNPIWRLTDRDCDPTQWQAESGQMLVSKTAREGMNLAILLAAWEMNRDIEFWYKLSGGDKDTFRYAAYFLALPYSAAPHYPASAGALVRPFEGHQFCGHTMVQFGLSPAEWSAVKDKLDPHYEPPLDHAPPLFLHANLLKHSGNVNRPGATWQTIKSPLDDSIHRPASDLLEKDLRFKVSIYRGMCTDIWDGSPALEGGAGSRGEEQRVGSFELGRVHYDDFKHAWGALLADFEQMYFEEGGQAGGW